MTALTVAVLRAQQPWTFINAWSRFTPHACHATGCATDAGISLVALPHAAPCAPLRGGTATSRAYNAVECENREPLTVLTTRQPVRSDGADPLYNHKKKSENAEDRPWLRPMNV